MKKGKKIFGILMFSIYFLICIQQIEVATANFLPMPFSVPKPAFIIQSDGNVSSTDNVTVPITKNGHVYSLTDDIVGHTIVVDCDDVTVDGAGYVIQGNGNSTGVFIKNRNGITVQNMQISNFYYGIQLLSDPTFRISGNHTLLGNNLTNNHYGIEIVSSTGNTLRHNQMNSNNYGFKVTYSAHDAYVSTASPRIFYHDIDDSNTINGAPIYYWVNQENRSVPSDAACIGLVNCVNISVQHCSLSQNGKGIILVSTKNSTITNNEITKNNGEGIYLLESTNNYISENVITKNNGYELYLCKSSNNNSICNNTITGTEDNYGIKIHSSSHNIFSGNTLTENKLGAYVLSSAGVNFIDNNIKRNTVGIYIDQFNSGHNIIGNTIEENTGYGIKLVHTSGNSIVENIFYKNANGIYCTASPNNKIVGNNFTENVGWAIEFEGGLAGGGANNSVYHNYFIDNNKEVGFQVSMLGIWDGQDKLPQPCIWDDGEKGNYWSGYTLRYPNATEINGTGIGDTPFYINPNNIDHHPIMKLETIPEFPSWTILPIIFVIVFSSIIGKKVKI
ncbi:MAG: NosD domain-containing protein [Candidatus Bathyarchaeum tardum]|nr:MAG: NosD domain-containing protein [Candidatus Bathyarchaeum tardum]